jgi:fibrillarin-like pre-rRNA processing protein
VNVFHSNSVAWINIHGEKQLATLNLVKGVEVYGERLVKYDGDEYRVWDPFRSKLAAALKNGLTDLPVMNKSKVLYIGASTGTTVSHISDIIGINGLVFAVESSSRVARELLENLASKRENIVPILEDARKPRSYFSVFGTVDVLYCDIAQPDQTEIAIANCVVYLKPDGALVLVVKTRSINVLLNPKTVIAQEAKKLENSKFSIKQIIDLAPFDKDHALIRAIYEPK